MPYYNMTNVTLANSTAEMFLELNKAAGFWPANAVVIVFFIVSFLVAKGAFEDSPARAITASLFLTSIISILLFTMGVLQIYVLVMVLVLFGLSVSVFRHAH